MPDWWSYRLEDFLLFSPRVYWRMFELHNAAWWPIHLATMVVGAAAVVLAWRHPRGQGHWILLFLAALWAFVGWSFLWDRYSAINWAISYIASVFWLEAFLLAALGTSRRSVFDRTDVAARVGLLLALAGILAYPLLTPVFGRPWRGGEVFGIAPDPTAIVTLGILLTVRDRWAWPAFPIPLLWLLTSGLTLRTMDDPQGWAPLLFAGMVAALLVWRRIRSSR